MLQLNDISHTLIDLSKKNLKGISYHSNDEITVKFKLDDVVIETSFEYETADEARNDYQMLIDMVDEDKYRASTSFGVDTEQFGFENLTNLMDEARNRWKEEKT